MVCSLLALLSYHFGVLFSILAVTSLLCPNKNCPPARPGRRKGPKARETEPKQNNYPKLLILTINTYNIRLKFSGGGILVARNINEGSGCADHIGCRPEDHYSAFRGRKICPLKGAPSIATHTFREVVGGA